MTEAELVAEYRRKNPRSRAQSMFIFEINTGSRKNMRCIVCGQTGPIWSAEYRKTKRALVWEADHRERHLGKETGDASLAS